MHSIKFKTITTVFILVACVFIFDSTVRAQGASQNSAISISAVPSIIDKGGKPGETVEFSVKVTNDSAYVLPIHVSARPMLGMAGETEGFVQSHSAQQWVTIAEPDFLLDAGKDREITGTFTIPEETGPEGYYADIIVRPLGIREPSGNIRTQPELTIRLLVRVAGEAVQNVESDIVGGSFVLTKRGSDKSLKYTLSNVGNVHEMVQARLKIRRDGEDVATKEIAPTFMMPREDRELSFTIPDEVGGGIFEASMEYSYGAPEKTLSSPDYRVFMIPFSPALLLAVPLGILGFIVWRYYKRVVRAFRILAKGDKAGN